MKDKAKWRWSVYTALQNREGVNVFDWPGNSDRGSVEHYEKEIC